VELAQPPSDGITSSIFANTTNNLLVTSWDATARLYDSDKNELIHTFEQKGPLLDGSFSLDDSKAYVGGVENKLFMLDLKVGSRRELGSHQKPIKCVEYCAATGLIFTGSWDQTLKLWDPRAHDPLSGSYELKGRIFSMGLTGNRAVIATSGRHVTVFDVRKMSEPEQDRLSSLSNQLRIVRCFPDGTGYAVGSCEGRVAIEYFDTDPNVQKKKYAFKCHRKTENGAQTLFPVNALAFHPIYGTFASGGCDGVVNVWDGFAKKRICQYPRYQTSIAYLDYNKDGTKLAVTQSYTFESGERDHPSDTVFIRPISEKECKNKLARV